MTSSQFKSYSPVELWNPGNMPTSTLDEDSIEISSSERFQPRNDDEDELWDVEAIISEKPIYYKVEWAGVDPATGKKWPSSWVRKGDVTDDLVKKWKLKKKQQQQEKAARKRRKSGKRDPAMSAALASRSNSTRRSASTAKAPTPATSVSESPRVSRQSNVSPALSQNGRLSNHETYPSPLTHNASSESREPSPILEDLENLKRKRDSSIGSVSITSPPQFTTVLHSPTVTRPRKKRRLGSTYNLPEISEEDAAEIQRPTKNGLQDKQAVLSDESEEEDPSTIRKKTRRESEQLKNGRTREAAQKQEVVRQGRVLEDPSTQGKKTRRESEQLKNGRAREKEVINEDDDDEVEVVSSPPKGAKSRPHPRAINGPKKPVLNVSPIPGPSPTRQRKDGNDAKQKPQQMNGVTRTRSKEANCEPSVREPLDDARRKPVPRRRTRELSPATLKRLQRFDAELDELERERERQEFNAKSDVAQENVEEADESGLEYVSPAAPVSSLPSRSSPNFVPASQPMELVPQHPQRHLAPKVPINDKITDGSFRQGIVPETEPEDFSANTQSQSQPVLSLLSMVVEPPNSLRSRPSTPSQAHTSKSRPGSSNAQPKPSVREQPHSQDADISTPFDSTELESQEVTSPSQPILYPTTAQALPSADSSNRAGRDGVDDLTSSIEQFSSPEKPRLEKRKRQEPNGRERSPAESTTIRKRGQQLAETARLARLQSRPQAAKRPLSEVIAQQVQQSRSVVKNGLPLTSVPHATLSSTLESVPSFPNSISHTMAISNRGMPEVPEEVVQELEAALIDLDGGTNKQTEDDTMEDGSTSLQKSSNDSVMTNASSVFALRQEEEESTQDLLREAAIAAQEDQVTENFDAEMDNEPILSRNQERQLSQEVELAPRGSPRLAQARSPSVVSAAPVGPPQCDLDKEAPLDRPLSPLEPSNAGLREIKAVYDRDRAEWQAELASLKAEWEAERASLTALAKTAAKAKEEAIKETNFFREQYARASGFVTSVRDENLELEKRAKVAEDQAKSGVAVIRATFENRIKELEQHVEKWQMMATFLMQKDQRTDNDELRRRAAEEPELRVRCKSQQEDINALSSEIIQLEDELKLSEKMAKNWKQEADRLAEELNDCKAEVERLTEAAAENETVYRCLWRLESDKPCEEVFSSAEDLKAHLYSAGHITWD